MTAEILLGTVAIEPNRWAQVDPAWGPTIAVSDWLGAIDEAGFDGIEVWEKHLTAASAQEADAVLAADTAVMVFNSYVSLDESDPAERGKVAEWAHRTGSRGVKFNVGNDAALESAYAERIAAWIEAMPTDTALLCECHHGISIAEEPSVAARIFEAAAPKDRLQAIVHTHEGHDAVKARFDAYGDRITHAHVNYLDFASGAGPPPLADQRDRLFADVENLKALGFTGSWTIEFTHGTLSGDNDNPKFLMTQAAADQAVLREVLT